MTTDLWIFLGLMIAFVVPIMIYIFSVYYYEIFQRTNLSPIYKGVTFFKCKRWSDGEGEPHDPKTCKFCNGYEKWKKDQDSEEDVLVKELAIKVNAEELGKRDVMTEYGYTIYCKVLTQAEKLRQREISSNSTEDGTLLGHAVVTNDYEGGFDNNRIWHYADGST